MEYMNMVYGLWNMDGRVRYWMGVSLDRLTSRWFFCSLYKQTGYDIQCILYMHIYYVWILGVIISYWNGIWIWYVGKYEYGIMDGMAGYDIYCVIYMCIYWMYGWCIWIWWVYGDSMEWIWCCSYASLLFILLLCTGVFCCVLLLFVLFVMFALLRKL